MSTFNKDKICKSCGIKMINVDASKVYCDLCFEKNREDSYNKFKKKLKEKNAIKLKIKQSEYLDYFNEVVKEPHHLTIVGFNEVSKIKAKSFCRILEIKWVDLLIKLKRIDDLYEYIKTEFNKSEIIQLQKFSRSHKYIKAELIYSLDIDYLYDYIGVKRPLPYTDEDYKNNFLELFNNFGRVPLYNEFVVNTNITIESYTNKFKLKGIIYDKIVKMYVDDIEFKKYKKLSKNTNQFEEITLKNISEILNTNYIPQSKFDWLKNDIGATLSIDGYYPEYNLMVEADGQQHKKAMGYFSGEKRFKRQVENDKIKDDLVLAKGYKLLRVYIKEPWQDRDYLKKRLINLGIKIPA